MTEYSTEEVRKIVTDLQNVGVHLMDISTRDIGHAPITDFITDAEKMCQIVKDSSAGVKLWCRKFFVENRPALWLLRGLCLGQNQMKEYGRYSYGDHYKLEGFRNEFAENYKDIFHNNMRKKWKEYEINYKDAVDFIKTTRLMVATDSRVIAIHENKQCVYYHMFDDCELCESRDRLKEDLIENARAMSTNIFVNQKLMVPFFMDWISYCKISESMKEAMPTSTINWTEDYETVSAMKEICSRWVPKPIMSVDMYCDRSEDAIISSKADRIAQIKKDYEKLLKPGVTPIVIAKEWASYVVSINMYYRSMPTHNNLGDKKLDDYIMFMNCFSRVELLEALVPVIKEQCDHICKMI